MPETTLHLRARARIRQHTPGEMNRLEVEYYSYLDMLKTIGEVHGFCFESLKFKLADKTFYTPDFLVIRSDGSVEIHETKGFWEDDARVKIKVVAEQHPWFTFIGVTKDKKTKAWKYERFNE